MKMPLLHTAAYNYSDEVHIDSDYIYFDQKIIMSGNGYASIFIPREDVFLRFDKVFPEVGRIHKTHWKLLTSNFVDLKRIPGDEVCILIQREKGSPDLIFVETDFDYPPASVYLASYYNSESSRDKAEDFSFPVKFMRHLTPAMNSIGRGWVIEKCRMSYRFTLPSNKNTVVAIAGLLNLA